MSTFAWRRFADSRSTRALVSGVEKIHRAARRLSCHPIEEYYTGTAPPRRAKERFADALRIFARRSRRGVVTWTTAEVKIYFSCAADHPVTCYALAKTRARALLGLGARGGMDCQMDCSVYASRRGRSRTKKWLESLILVHTRPTTRAAASRSPNSFPTRSSRRVGEHGPEVVTGNEFIMVCVENQAFSF